MMLTKRDFLKAALAATASSVVPSVSLATVRKPWLGLDSMVLNLKRGNEEFLIDLRMKGHWNIFRYVTRDIQANTMALPDPDLGGLLAWMQHEIALSTGEWKQFVITSGLRTKQTNDKTEGAAKNSMHLPDQNGTFRAVDLRVPGVSTKTLGSLAWKAQEGGVGLYYNSGFVHLDTGRVRRW